MRYVFGRAATGLLLGGSLASCAGFAGQPKPVFTTAQIVQVAQNYALPSAYGAYSGKDEFARKAYRNEFIFANMSAIDARYDDFRGQLSTEHKGLNLGIDTILLGLAGAGSLASKAANELAVATSGVVGLRGAVDRNVFFDKTLPALLAAMDAERFRIATAMFEKMDRPAADYPLVAAISDLRAYTNAGKLDEAILQVTQDAASDRKEAKAAFDHVVRFACEPSAELGAASLPIGNFNRSLARAAIAERDANTGVAKLNEFKALAALYNVPTTTTIDEMMLGIVGAMNAGFCTVEELDRFKTQLRAKFPQSGL